MLIVGDHPRLELEHAWTQRELDMNKTEEWNGKSFAVLKWNLFGFLFFAL
jgi:hypothetical protein